KQGGKLGGSWQGRRGERRTRRSLNLKLERLEPRVVLTPLTWTPGAGTLRIWSDQNNWQPVKVPANNDTLTFPTRGTGDGLNSTNDLAAGLNFGSLSVQNNGYTIGGSSVALTGIVASYTSGSSTVNLPINFGGTAGAVTVNNAGTVLSLGGAISGTGGLTK